MKNGNSFKLAAGGLSDELTLHDAPDASVFDDVKLRVSVPVNNSGAQRAGTAADLVAVLDRAIGGLTLEHGPTNARRLAYANVKGSDLRIVHRIAQQNDVPNNIVGAQIAAGDSTLEAVVRVPFRIPWLRGMRKRPGTQQVRAMKIKIVEGGTAANRDLGAGLTRRDGAFITIEVEFNNKPGNPLQIAPILSLARENSPRRDAKGPDGLTVAAWVNGYTAAACPLNAFRLELGGTLVHDLQAIKPVTQAYEEEGTDGLVDKITDAVAVLYIADANEKIEELPHGELRFEQAQMDLSPIDLRVLHYPAHDQTSSEQQTIALAEAVRAPVLTTAAELPPFAAGGAASVAPIVAYTPSDARFVSEPGLVAVPGQGTATVAIPEATKRVAESAAKGLGGVVGTAYARQIQKRTSFRVPGLTSSRGKGVGGLRSAVRGVFRGAFGR